MLIALKNGVQLSLSKKKQAVEYIQKESAIQDKYVSMYSGIPKQV